MQSKTISSFIPTARLLLDAFRAFENDLAQQLAVQGFDDLTTGNFNLIRHLNPEGMRLVELARDAQLSKQAIGKMVNELEYKAYVEVVPDATDGRAKFVRFTPRGRKLIEQATLMVADIERHYQSMLGKKDYQKLRQAVTQIAQWHVNKERL
ncbi:MAG: MarR family transcriptional regulator [Gammaproteobacteria bacterium]|nr:MarR family transcriptional regulator [Gammaproteobacteria bacterium]